VLIGQAGKEIPSIMVTFYVRAEFVVLIFKYVSKRKVTLSFVFSILPYVSERISLEGFSRNFI
jgi:hypothetical protein